MNMNISFHVPEFVLWLIGIPIGIVILFVLLIGLRITIWAWRESR